MTSASPAPDRSAAFGVYRNPRVLGMLFLGFSSGLPYPLVFATLTTWLAATGVSKSSIGMFAWVGFVYSLKFAWAPLVDRLPLPLLTAWLGRRRSWMLLAQTGVLIALLALATAEPAVNLAAVAWLALAVAFCSATQDIALDAYRIEAVAVHVQGAMAASYQFGYRVAVLMATAGALYIAQFVSWSSAYRVLAALMAVGMVTVLLVAEPETPDRPVAPHNESLSAALARWFMSAVYGPFAEFFRRNGAWALLLLLFIATFRISDLVMGIMANPFYIDIGFSLSQIATITKVFGFAVTLTGAALGGLAVARFGVGRPLIAGAVSLAVANLFFALMASRGADLRLLVMTISADNLAVGFAGTVFIAFLSGLTNAAYTATQYALFSSLMMLPGKLLAGFSGKVVDRVGWVNFFLYAAVIGLPAVILATVVARREHRAS